MQARHDQAGGGQALPAGDGGADAGDDVAAFGLTEQAAAAPQAGEPGPAPMPDHPVHDHPVHDHPVHDHEHMFFTMFRRNEAGEVVEVAPADITRDTSQYDEEGHDPGTGKGPVTPPPGAPHDEHHH